MEPQISPHQVTTATPADGRGKPELRALIRSLRRAISPGETEIERTAALTERLAQLATQAQTIACFYPTPEEPDTTSFMVQQIQAGKRILLPVCRRDGTLDWADFESKIEISSGIWQTPEPTGPRLGTGALDLADLILVPAAAVDLRGIRLGWGQGFYDRALAGLNSKAPTWAVVYDSEVFDTLPQEDHDHPVTGVVTPARTQRFHSTIT